jgi:hypothetical protein
MLKALRTYRKLEKHIIYMIIAEAFIQLINASFILILLIYMSNQGYSRAECAEFFKYRFLGVLLFAFPLGLFIKRRKIKPLFYISGFFVPIFSLLVIHAVDHQIDWLLYFSQIMWGISFIFLQVSALPYIMRYARKDTVTEAISLNHSTWSLAGIIGGTIIFGFKFLFPESFNEKLILQILAIAGFASLWFIHRITYVEDVAPAPKQKSIFSNIEWNPVVKALIPTLLIAVGAGLTIPFIGLFFKEIHGLESYNFSLVGAAALILVFGSMMLVPRIKSFFGYRIAIPLTQSLAVLALIGLATTELYQFAPYGVALAVLFFILRQPLMNLAGPMTSEVTLKYVGKNNLEITSSLTAAIWSGSWFISGGIFEVLSRQNMSYMNIFLITAGMYAIAIFTYYLLIVDYEKKQKLGLVE